MSSTLCTGTRHGHLHRHATTALPRASMTVFSARESSTRCTTRFLKWPLCDTRIRVSTLEPPSSTTEHVKWFDKFSEFWLTAHSAEDLQRILSNETDRFIFVDFYAGHCGACRAAFPQLSRIAGNPDYQQDFLFVKACVTDEGIRDFVRKEGITGIPMAIVYEGGGQKLISFGASFRKINAIKANLLVIAANRGKEFVIDPNGFVMPRLEDA